MFALSNLPIMVWMLYSHFKDIPREILEAARMDGATLWQEVRLVLLPPRQQSSDELINWKKKIVVWLENWKWLQWLWREGGRVACWADAYVTS